MNDIISNVDPERGFRLWRKSELADGVSLGKYLPNIDDLFVDVNNSLYRVADVDYTTQSYTEEFLMNLATAQTDNEGNRRLHNAESNRLFIDTSVMPHTVRCSRGVEVAGSSHNKVKYVRGASGGTTGGGEVLSRVYNDEGVLISDAIELELIDSDKLYKVPKQGHIAQALLDGESIYAIFFDANDQISDMFHLVVRNTTWSIKGNSVNKLVDNIELVSSFLSKVENDLLEVPININNGSIDLMVKVNYHDGSASDLISIGDPRIKVFNLDKTNTVANATRNVTVIYTLAEDESAVNISSPYARTVARTYTLKNVLIDKAYALKIFTYPEWVNSSTGYVLRHYLCNLDRTISIDITSNVTLGDSAAFNGKLYAVKQHMQLVVNLEDVDSTFKDYRHVQDVAISLNRPGNQEGSKWLIDYSDDGVSYGGDAVASISQTGGFWETDITSGKSSLEAWLSNFYYASEPLYDPSVNTKAPTPNAFSVVYNNETRTYPIEDWNTDLLIDGGAINGGLVIVKLLYQDVSNTWDLGVIAFPIKIN